MKKCFKAIASFLIITFLTVSTLVVTGSTVFADNSTTASNVFIGQPLANDTLENLSNTSLDAEGHYTIPIRYGKPQITFLIPGFDSQASVWSNNYSDEMSFNTNGVKNEKIAYNSRSLLEKMRLEADAKVYYADILTVYSEENGRIENSLPFDDEVRAPLDELEFALYEYPTFGSDLLSDYHFEEELEVFDLNRASTVTAIDEVNCHIIVLFNPKDASGSNQQIYEQFNYVADKIVYDVKIANGGYLPKVNLVAHSRGGLTAMQYALDHPYIVDSMITIGTPFHGAALGEIDGALELLGMSADRTNDGFSYGVEDILDEEIFTSYRNKWNSEYEQKYSNINFVAIGGTTSYEYLTSLLELATSSNGILDLESNSTPNLTPVANVVNYILVEANSGMGYFNDDIFIDLSSQQAEGYLGVKKMLRIFAEEDSDKSMLATSNIPVPHNLEPGDAKIHSMILSQLHFSDSAFQYIIENNYITITSCDRTQRSGNLTIPETIDGIPVKKIGDYAFSNLDIEAVVLPKRLEEIGDYAFYSCKSLTSIAFESTSNLTRIGEYAFANCSSLSDFSVPDGCHRVCDYAFANTNISRAYVNFAIEYYASTAFYGAPIEEYYQTVSPAKYAVIDGVLYDVRLNRMVAYPSHSTATSFTMPSNITIIEDYAFAGSENLVSVDLANVTSISDGAFYKCTNLINITGNNVSSIGDRAFYDTAFLDRNSEEISIGKVLLHYNTDEQTVIVEDYEYICSGAFSSCSNMETVILTGEIKTIDNYAFINSDALRTVYLKTNAVVNIGPMSFCTPVIDAIYVSSIKYEEYIASDELGILSDLYSKHTTIVTFDSNGGEPIPNSGFDYYSYIVLPTPTKDKYDFLGWYETIDGQERLVHNGETWLSISDSTTLTAKWRPTQYTIVFNTTDTDSEDSNITIEDTTFGVPTREGYSFAGWFTGVNKEGIQVTSSSGELLIEFDQLLEHGEIYAGWTPITYSVTYVLNGGTNNTSNPATFTIESGILSLYEPTRGTYYRFDGWYESPVFDQDTELTVIPAGLTRNITLYAKWIRLYSIQFNGALSSSDKYQYAAIGDELITPPIYDAYVYLVEGERVGSGYSFILEEDMLNNDTLVIERTNKTLEELYDEDGGYYSIYNEIQFYYIGSSTHSTIGKTYKLMNNITVSPTYGTYINIFEGILDGNGKNIACVRVDLDSNYINGGSFGLVKTNKGVIKNLTITSLELDVSTPTTDTGAWVMVGFVAGENYGTISNVTVKNCDMIADRHTTCMGGIVGNNQGTIENCYAQNLTIVGSGNLGGIAGANCGEGVIRYCYTSGCTITVNVNFVNRAVGGICGYSWNNALIEYCRVTTTSISVSTYNLANNAVQPMIGKVVGYIQNSTMRNVGSSSTTIDSSALPDPTYILWWISFDPEAYVGKADAYSICGRNDGGSISSIQWAG